MSAAEARARDAWEELAATGYDVSLLEENLRLTPLERIRQHDRARAAVLELRRAMEPRDARS